MWWLGNLVMGPLFRALHNKEKRLKGHITRNQFFLITIICSLGVHFDSPLTLYCIAPLRLTINIVFENSIDFIVCGLRTFDY
ncbi:hypothetical protein LIER_37930 [Lithospermum erythrorhizon]|uniref:Uncharacterized protein n=1 Tax=Lithospermum erythrorhizon TaxID=34254 RepID=A0AAV3PU74_LITER